MNHNRNRSRNGNRNRHRKSNYDDEKNNTNYNNPVQKRPVAACALRDATGGGRPAFVRKPVLC